MSNVERLRKNTKKENLGLSKNGTMHFLESPNETTMVSISEHTQLKDLGIQEVPSQWGLMRFLTQLEAEIMGD